tara:strand:- start:358 stop:753 length:396 start_codon:yes stop_codon:yes gene_type:complete
MAFSSHHTMNLRGLRQHIIAVGKVRMDHAIRELSEDIHDPQTLDAQLLKRRAEASSGSGGRTGGIRAERFEAIKTDNGAYPVPPPLPRSSAEVAATKDAKDEEEVISSSRRGTYFGTYSKTPSRCFLFFVD